MTPETWQVLALLLCGGILYNALVSFVQAEITAVLTKHGCKLDAVPVLLSDGRISAQLLVSCI